MISDSALEIEYHRQRADALCKALFFRLEEYVEDFPSGSPQKLILFFKDIVKEIESAIELTSDANELGLICRAINMIATYAMKVLDHAHTAQTPRGLAQFLEQLHRKLQSEAVLLVTPLSEYNYTIANHFPELNKILCGTVIEDEMWLEISKDFRKGLYVVRFPRVERDNILLHSIFGHEFGHPIADKFLLKEQATENYKAELITLKERVNEDFATDLEKLDEVERTKAHGKLCEMAIQMRRRGIEELVSDIVASILFGASALFAAAELLVPEGLDTPPRPEEYYPPSRYRLREMYKALTESNHISALKSLTVHEELHGIKSSVDGYLEYLERTIENTEDKVGIANNRLVCASYEWLENSLPAAIEFAKTEVEEIAYKEDDLRKEIPEALLRIQLGIPPGEMGMPPSTESIDWRSAILAGWIHKLHYYTNSEIEFADRTEKVRNINAITLKGVEDAILRYEYESNTTELVEQP